MKLITNRERKKLLSNWDKAEQDENFDPEPVVMLYTLFRPCSWLLTQLNPNFPDLAYGLCDLGMGCPEIGTVSLTELAALRVGPAPMVERDRFFKPKTTLQGYANEARMAGKILP